VEKKQPMKLILIMLLITDLALPVFADERRPGEGIRVQPARATWTTGYFQEAIVRAGLKELGYRVKRPKELTNPLFYLSVTLGDVDYWTNGWFPMHKEHMPKDFAEKGERVGFVVKSGGLQGYLVSKRDVEKFHIRSLDDFKRPEVKKAFDRNGDGKADLVTCPPGWGCETTITYHLDVYGMEDHINPIKAGYIASMADATAAYRAGEPVFFFTWAPNWTIFTFKPGRDVMWINVPEIRARPVEMEAVDRMTVSGVKGAVSDPVKLGFVVADIQIVANKKFLTANPAAKTFFKLFALPLEDINEQNAKMQNGENTQKDIERHAREWIQKNQDTWNKWLDAARKAGR